MIRGIFFPLLSFATGTGLPLVIVESCSMYHEGNLASNFEEWWERHELKYSEYFITENNFLNFPFKNGLNKGDILFVTGTAPEKIRTGDIIIFDAGAGNPIIHRVIKITEEGNEFIFSTEGDNNNGQLGIEKRIYENQIVGIPRANILPYVGWIKLFWFELAKEFDKNPETKFEGFCEEN